MIYHIYANRSNIGDWLSARGIQKLLSPLEITECLCDKPFINKTMKSLRKATPNDLIVIGGGGLFMDYFEPFWSKFRDVALKIPFCIWGVGVCDLKAEKSLLKKSLIEEIVKKSKLCVVRDQLTFDYLSNCKIPAPVHCPSVCVISAPKVPSRDLVHVVNYSTVGAKHYKVMCQIAQDFAQQTGRVYRETNNRIAKITEAELSQVLLRYEKSDMVLSSGLHGCIIGVAMGLKVLAVSGDRKIDAFMESVGLKDWVLDPNETGVILQRLKDLKKQVNPNKVINHIRKENQNIAYQIKMIADKR